MEALPTKYTNAPTSKNRIDDRFIIIFVMKPETKISNALVLVPRQEQNQEEVLVEKVKDLFEVNAVHGLLVEEYYAMREEERIDLCETLLPITLCKVPECDGIGMWFFISKEVLV